MVLATKAESLASIFKDTGLFKLIIPEKSFKNCRYSALRSLGMSIEFMFLIFCVIIIKTAYYSFFLCIFPESFLQGCVAFSGVPENLLQGCDNLSELPESLLLGCRDLSGRTFCYLLPCNTFSLSLFGFLISKLKIFLITHLKIIIFLWLEKFFYI